MSNWGIELVGVSIGIESKSVETDELLDATLNNIVSKGLIADPQASLTVEFINGAWQFSEIVSGLNLTFNLPGDFLYHLTDRIVFHIANSADRVHCLHAGAVELDGQAILCPADSGSGKSTFISWLVTSGFSYITDELVWLDKDHKLGGLARPIQIKPSGVSAVRRLISDHSEVVRGDKANSLTFRALGANLSVGQPDLRVVIFPKYEAGAEFNLSPISAGIAGLKIMSHHVNARNLQGHGFRSIMNSIKQVPCYQLTYSEFSQLNAVLFQKLIANS